MSLVPLTSAGVPPRRSRWRVAGASVLLHLAVLAALLLWARAPELPQPAPSYDLVFEDLSAAAGGGSPAGEPAPAEDTPAEPPAPAVSAQAAAPSSLPDALPGPESPSPIAPPAAEAPLAPPPASAPPQAQPTPEPAPQAEASPAAPPEVPPRPAPSQLAMQDVPPLPVEPAPELAPAPSTPAIRVQPQVRLEQPVPQPPLAPPTSTFVPPLPPPPLPPPTPPAPRPRTAPPPGATIGSLSNPMDLNFRGTAPREPAARVGAAPGSVASRSVDLSTGPGKPGPNRQDAFFDARAAKLGADWMEGVRSYWLRHRYYPAQAAQNGEDGTVDIELVVNRYGRVQSVNVKSRSGSTWLDMAATGTFRNAQLPPVPAEVEAPYAFTLSIHYILMR